jgi:ATPase subunit of ABC transporter with duplicated ATPase domains
LEAQLEEEQKERLRKQLEEQKKKSLEEEKKEQLRKQLEEQKKKSLEEEKKEQLRKQLEDEKKHQELEKQRLEIPTRNEFYKKMIGELHSVIKLDDEISDNVSIQPQKEEIIYLPTPEELGLVDETMANKKRLENRLNDIKTNADTVLNCAKRLNEMSFSGRQLYCDIIPSEIDKMNKLFAGSQFVINKEEKKDQGCTTYHIRW